jgi:hypothetical protein
MAEYAFQNLSRKGKIDLDKKLSPQDSRDWFRDQALRVKGMSVPKFQADTTPFQNIENLSINSIGRMYCFVYDPKNKDDPKKLPYYDTFPLIFPVDFQKDGFLGINLHYLSPFLRAKLMDSLYTTLNNTKYNKTTKLQISYQILKGAAQMNYFKPCLKKYLADHVRSPFMYITPNQWDYTLMLPLERFQRRSKEFVWMESMLSV